MDEPFGALDPLTRDELQREFLLLQQRLHKTVVFVTHDLREALRLGSRIALMEAGRLVTVLAPEGVSAVHRSIGLRLRQGLRRWFGVGGKSRHVMNVFRFMWQNHAQVLELTLEHLRLVGFSTLFAMLIGIPLGIVIAHRPRFNKPVLASANIIQTIPSLALFGFLLPVPWLGERADRLAILALTLYALLPIIRNTYTGIRGVDPAVVEAGRGMGLTESQLLFQVELPLAVSVILSGVRVAVVISVGLATIAAAIGAGGLGEFIFRGLAMVDDRVILAGAIPAALLALLADFGVGWLERRLQPTMSVLDRVFALRFSPQSRCFCLRVRLRTPIASWSAPRISPSRFCWARSWRSRSRPTPLESGSAFLSGRNLYLPAGNSGGANRCLSGIHGHGADRDSQATMRVAKRQTFISGSRVNTNAASV